MVFHDIFLNARDSFKVLIQQRIKIIFPIILELMFFLVLGFFSGPLLNEIFTNLVYIGDLMAGESVTASKNMWDVVVSSESFAHMALIGVVLILVVYVLYCLFHGIIWRYCMGLNGKGTGYMAYIKRFFLVNILWYILYIFIYLIYFFLFYIDTVGRRINPSGFYFISVIPIFFLLVVVYFALISYVLIYRNNAWKSIRKSIKIGILRSYPLIGNMFLLIIFFFVLNYFLYLLSLVSFVLLVIGGIVILMPMLVFARVYIQKVVDSV